MCQTCLKETAHSLRVQVHNKTSGVQNKIWLVVLLAILWLYVTKAPNKKCFIQCNLVCCKPNQLYCNQQQPVNQCAAGIEEETVPLTVYKKKAVITHC